MRVLGLLIIVFLPEIIVPVAFHLYKDVFYEDVVASLEQLVDDDPYCIIVPRVNRVKQQRRFLFFMLPERIYSSREWVIVMDPAQIDYPHILDHAIRQELLFYAKEGRSYGTRAERGTEMHFGVAKKDAFYVWSFKNRRFVEHVVPVPSKLYRMKKRYMDYRRYQRYGQVPTRINPDDYYCPFLYDEL
ncbi:MAG: hypothetical protein JKX92_14190 [Porticoccaceae bacterium]|nr:hypothetical protein [Porticoccaceae bacterium]